MKKFSDIKGAFTNHGISLQLDYQTATEDPFDYEAEEVFHYGFEGTAGSGTTYFGEFAVPEYAIDDICYWAEGLSDMLYDGIGYYVFTREYPSILDAPDFDDIDYIFHGIHTELDKMSEEERASWKAYHVAS